MVDGPQGRDCTRTVITRETDDEVYILEVLEDVRTGELFFRSVAPVTVWQPAKQGVPFDIEADSIEEALDKWMPLLQEKQREFQAQQQEGPNRAAPAQPQQSPQSGNPAGETQQQMIDLSEHR